MSMEDPPQAGNGITPVHIEDEMRQSYMEYAMSVIIGRALPDVRDGLKPVHRRVLYAMHEQGNLHNKAYRKSARVAGEVIGKYHPHGEAAVYDSIVRMAQNFSMRVPLVDGQGNFGSVDGDPPAAMRYTEVRMTPLAHRILEDLEKGTVDFQSNYDESLQEPLVLPARFPNLLVNGTTGIAVGMASNIPPHNLLEALDAFLYLIDHPNNPNLAELMDLMPGPDFPTGGMIMGRQGIVDAYTTGRGLLTVRSRTEIETNEKTSHETIVVHELPYMVNKARLIEKIAELVRHKRLDGVADLRDESDRQGMRMVIEVKRNFDAEVLLNNLFKLTKLQTSYGVIMLAVADSQPCIFPLVGMLRRFLSHRIEVVERRTKFDLAKATQRAHILQGFQVILGDLEAVIELIKTATDAAQARKMLIAKYQLSEIQAKEVLDLRLGRLTGLEQNKIAQEHTELQQRMQQYQTILADRNLVLDVIRSETRALREQYGKQQLHQRRTQIMAAAAEWSQEDLVTEEDMVVTISHKGFIKRTPVSAYRTQHRGGKGSIGMTTREEDFVTSMFVASTHDMLLFFTSFGKCYQKKVYELPVTARASRGKSVNSLLSLETKELVRAYLNVSGLDKSSSVVMVTSSGIAKKTLLESFANVRRGGLRAINIDEGDSLQAVNLCSTGQEIFLATSRGMSLRFPEKQIRATGRAARGVIGLRLNPDDRVVGMEILSSKGAILTLTENGFGKKTLVHKYPLGNRGNKGVYTIKTSERNGKVVGILQVFEDQEVIVISQTGKLIRMRLDTMRDIGRHTQGVRMVQIGEGEKVVAFAKLVNEQPPSKPAPPDTPPS